MATEWIFKGTGATKFRTQGKRALDALKRGGRPASRWLDVPGARIFVRVLPRNGIEQVWIFAGGPAAGVFRYTTCGLSAYGPPYGPPYGRFAAGQFRELSEDTTDYTRMKSVYERLVGNSAVPAWIVLGAAMAYARAQGRSTAWGFTAAHSAGAGDAYGVRVLYHFVSSKLVESVSVTAAADIVAAYAAGSSAPSGTSVPLPTGNIAVLTPSILTSSPFLIGVLKISGESTVDGDPRYITSLDYTRTYVVTYNYSTYTLNAAGNFEYASTMPYQLCREAFGTYSMVVRWDITEFFPPHESTSSSEIKQYEGSHFGVDTRTGGFFAVATHPKTGFNVQNATLGGVDVTGLPAAYFPDLDLLSTSPSWNGTEVIINPTAYDSRGIDSTASGIMTLHNGYSLNTLDEEYSATKYGPVAPLDRYRIVNDTYDTGLSRTRDIYYPRSTGVQVATLHKEDGVVTALRDGIGLSQTGMDQLMYDDGRDPLVILNL